MTCELCEAGVRRYSVRILGETSWQHDDPTGEYHAVHCKKGKCEKCGDKGWVYSDFPDYWGFEMKLRCECYK